MTILVDETTTLESVQEIHAPEIFNLVSANRQYLARWLPWVDAMKEENFIVNFIKGSRQRTSNGTELAFVIIFSGKIVGRIGIYKIDQQNRSGEIGYWVAENMQGKGLATKTCRALINYGLWEMKLNRIEIRCGQNNHPSRKVPEKLGFKKEGTLRQAELLRQEFIDLDVYSLLAGECPN